jgi:hypothetical protein
MVKLNQNSYLGHMTIPIIMKKLNASWRGVHVDFFLHTYQKFSGFAGEFQKFPENFRNCPFFRPEEISALDKLNVTI